MRKSYQRTAGECLLILTLIFSLSANSFAQTADADAPVVVPETQMKQIVRRILIYYFKPAKQPKDVYLAEQGIRKEWLPEIKNIRFHLLSAEEVKQKGDVYFFTEPRRDTKGGTYIGFAHGVPNCGYSGDEWNFRVSNQKLRLWMASGRMGGGCSSFF